MFPEGIDGQHIFREAQMAEIIDIRGRLRGTALEAVRAETGAVFRVRVCGPDLHWIGVVGGILARALAAEGLPTAFADVEGAPAPLLAIDLITGGAASIPGLVVAGCRISPAALRGCDQRTVLLTRRKRGRGEQAFDFAGREVPLPTSAPEPLGLAAACAGGAARLLGIIGWSALEQGLRQELTLAVPLESHLILAFETYQRLAPWAGAVSLKSP
jgi:hypothetical protein